MQKGVRVALYIFRKDSAAAKLDSRDHELKQTFSPAWLMAIRLLTSIRSSRPQCRHFVPLHTRSLARHSKARDALAFDNRTALIASILTGNPQHGYSSRIF